VFIIVEDDSSSGLIHSTFAVFFNPSI